VQTIRTDVVNFTPDCQCVCHHYPGHTLLAVSLAATVIWLSPAVVIPMLWSCFLYSDSSVGLVVETSSDEFPQAAQHGFALFDIALQIILGYPYYQSLRAEETEARLSIDKGNHFFQVRNGSGYVKAQVQTSCSKAVGA
jgi:hypothetical protein